MLVLVHLDDGVEALSQGAAVGREADDREDDGGSRAAVVVAADLVEFGRVARVDAVARGQARVAG